MFMSRTPDSLSLMDFTLRAAGWKSSTPWASVLTEYLNLKDAAAALAALPEDKRAAIIRDLGALLARNDDWTLQANAAGLTAALLAQITAPDVATVRALLAHIAGFETFARNLDHKAILAALERRPEKTFDDAECRALLERARAAIRTSRLCDNPVTMVEILARYARLFGVEGAGDVRAASAAALFADENDLTIAEESPQETALLDAWIAAWTRRIEELRSGLFASQPVGALSALGRSFGFGASNFDKARRSAEAIIQAAIPRAKSVGYELRNAMDRANFDHIRGFGTLPGIRHFDADWLAELRAGAAQWRKLGPQPDWSGERVPRAAPFAALDVGGRTLGDLLWSQRQAKPAAKWRAEIARAAAGPQGAAAREALLAFARALATATSSSSRVRLWRLVDAYQEFREHVKTQNHVFGDVGAATCVQMFDYFGYFIIYADGSGNFGGRRPDPALLSDGAVILARSTAWALAQWRDAEAVAALRDLALAMLVKIATPSQPQAYRSLTVANAAIAALGEIATPEAVTALGAIKLKLRDERLVKQVAAAMQAASAKAGMSVEELEEVSAPTFDLDEVGRARLALGDHVATLAIHSTKDVALEIARPDGKIVKSVPASVKADAEAAAALKALKARQKEIEQALPVHARRIEASWFSDRATAYADWRARTLDHVFVGSIARRLIWRLDIDGESLSAMLVDGALIDSRGEAITRDLSAAQVRLWHPIEADDAQIARWREFVMARRIVQPFKQAHREMYPLTDAERTTATYSNRYAGHILRQHQSLALARLKGWRATMRISADRPNDEPTHRRIPDFNLAVEFWTAHAGGDEAEFTAGLGYVFLQTDRVRFRRLDGALDEHKLGEVAPLADVPPRIFSEAMRDVDLFVGVASVANDPTWADGGAAAEHPSQWRREAATQYWNAHASGDLDVTARARREFLQQLLPSLSIAAQCSFDDRHLVVQGRRHAYRIHLGSGNILMENGRYLCIVPNSAGADEVFLPFEGDRMTSIVLSKALLLAADDRIRDETILRQL
ncbi:MAG: DUF4132 domain-containing protein [Methylobacteriaceae bacterium]|nr:DUF4132 domain-containing protein [Methylobacteriaceae bacterium]